MTLRSLKRVQLNLIQLLDQFAYRSGEFNTFITILNFLLTLFEYLRVENNVFFFIGLNFSERLGKQSFAYSPVEAAGWGDTAYTGPTSTRLKSVTLNIITNSQCNDNYPYRITESQMCLLTPSKDTCTVSTKYSIISWCFFLLKIIPNLPSWWNVFIWFRVTMVLACVMLIQ